MILKCADYLATLSYTDDQGFDEELVTPYKSIPFVDDGNAEFSISGTAEVGETLTIAEDKADPDGTGELTYQWQSSTDNKTWDDISTESTYSVQADDEGKSIRSIISYKDNQGFDEEIETNEIYLSSIAPIIMGLSGIAGDEKSELTLSENTKFVGTFSANETVTWSINEGGDDMTQMLIMTEHIRNIYKDRTDSLIRGVNKILDRCALDGIVYTHYLLDKGKISRTTYDACELIYKKLRNEYDVIFYTSPDDVELVDDGERSIDKHFREDIIGLFDMYLQYGIIEKGPRVILLEGTVEERLETIKSTLDKLNIDIKI